MRLSTESERKIVGMVSGLVVVIAMFCVYLANVAMKEQKE